MPAFNPETGTKVCSACRQEKPLSEYNKHTQTKDGYTYRCKVCAAEKMTESRKRRKDKGLPSYSQLYHRRTRLEVMQHYSGAMVPFCACCGETTFEFLSIDHINGGGTKHREEMNSRKSFYSWLQTNDYPEGYRVLCHNCNQALGHWGYCPHQRDGLAKEVLAPKTALLRQAVDAFLEVFGYTRVGKEQRMTKE